MEHEWKIGDWCELHGKRYLVFKRSDFDVWAIGLNHGIILFLVDDEEVKHLPDCDSWDWQPPKPEQYRPFANAAEFAPHRDKWLRSDTQSHGEVIGRVMNYSDKGIVDDVGNLRTFETLFRVCTFDDGTKCGVKLDDDAKPSGSGSK